jgi:hypothetical protein
MARVRISAETTRVRSGSGGMTRMDGSGATFHVVDRVESDRLADGPRVALVDVAGASVRHVVARVLAEAVVRTSHAVVRDPVTVTRVVHDVARVEVIAALTAHAVARVEVTLARVPATFHDVARVPVTLARTVHAVDRVATTDARVRSTSSPSSTLRAPGRPRWWPSSQRPAQGCSTRWLGWPPPMRASSTTSLGSR